MTTRTYGKIIASIALATVTAAAALPAHAQDRVRWRMHSTYPEAMPVAGATSYHLGKTIDMISGGAFDIRVFEPGALVAGTQYYDAVSNGSIDAAYGSPAFNTGKNSAYAFFAGRALRPRRR